MVFVVGLYCRAAKLVVDPRTAICGDGGQHRRFTNFTNDDIRDDLDWVLARINAALRLPFD